MKAIILGAGPGISLVNGARSYPKSMVRDATGRKVLDWIITALSEAGVKNITFVGGFHIEKIIENFPGLTYLFNPDWRTTGIFHSLSLARKQLNGPCVLTYADVVYRPDVVRDLTSERYATADVVLVSDQTWRERYIGRGEKSLSKAEKIVARNGQVLQIGKDVPSDADIAGEFVGILLVRQPAIQSLQHIFNEQDDSALSLHGLGAGSGLVDAVQYLVNQGHRVVIHSINGGWAELDAPQDLAQFVFGTKAETLGRLRPVVKRSIIGESFVFTVHEWEQDAAIIQEIQTRFPSKDIVVRSSALAEDSWQQSMAGHFLSVLHVPATDPELLRSAIEDVIASYRHKGVASGKNQVLIQECLNDVAVSGVLFARDLEHGSPYYLINYDDNSQRTDSVTSGDGRGLRTACFYKHSDTLTEEGRFRRLLSAVQELEMLTGHDFLDVEFVLDSLGDVHILQVRPLVANGGGKLVEDEDFDEAISEIKATVSHAMRPHIFLHGRRAIFSVMSDWNPAEMIGTKPKPLAASLYRHIITDHSWAKARAEIGYKDVAPTPLMHLWGGRPYIDLRASFNSFLPATLPPELSERLVNHCLDRLEQHPELHDKVEFEICFTCLTPDFDTRATQLVSDGFTREDLAVLKQALFVLTDNQISTSGSDIDRHMKQLVTLESRRTRCLTPPIESIPQALTILLGDCINYGTVPFSILARYAFIGVSFLKAFSKYGFLDAAELEAFLSAIPTVATLLSRDNRAVVHGKITTSTFLHRYGHLRPGSYDILSPRYDERPELYLGSSMHCASEDHPIIEDGVPVHPVLSADIDALLAREGFSFEKSALTSFIIRSIQARELAKFEFTKNLSLALQLLTRYGSSMGMSPDDLSYLKIWDVLRLAVETPTGGIEQFLRTRVEEGQSEYKICQALQLPPVLTSIRDIDMFELFEVRPNFITQRDVVSPTIYLDAPVSPEALDGKIVLINSADPGYDWIFSRDIKGLVTEYGGAASHMAIRAAEFCLPAAIGCGESLFKRLAAARRIKLCCGAQQIHILQ